MLNQEEENQYASEYRILHPELAVALKSVELAVCRGVISVCLESPLP